MSVIQSIVFGFAISILVVCGAYMSALKAADQPNIIIVFNDDMGYGDLGCFGATKIKTPRIDQLAQEGMRFTDFYVASPVCSASRASLLTGCYHLWGGARGGGAPPPGRGRRGAAPPAKIFAIFH